MNIKKYIIPAALASGLLLSSCSDVLDIEPRGTVVEDNFYRTEKDMQEALVAAYDVLQWGGYAGYSPFETLSDVASDDTHAGGSAASDQPSWVAWDNFTVDPLLGPQGAFWGKYYSGIYRANLFLEKIDASEASESFKAQTMGEAKFLRAYYYFNLVRLFGRVPLITKTLSPSEYNQEQNEPSDIYDQIELDLNDAIQMLPETVPAEHNGRVTLGAAKSLLARVMLFRDKLDNARMGQIALLCEEVIDMPEYELENDFGFIFTREGEFCKESIFEVNHSGDSKWGDWGWLSGGEGNIAVVMIGMRDFGGDHYSAGWGFAPVATDLAEAMKGDPRFAASIIDGAAMKEDGASYNEGYQNTDYFINKYAPLKENIALDGEAMINYPNNRRIIRLSDVMLMAAEAFARSGNENSARTYLNMVRDRNGVFALPPVNASGSDLLDAIYEERRMELAFEGVRFWDLIRTGRASQVLSGKGFQAHNEFLPIPQEEIDVTNRTITQNPGY